MLNILNSLLGTQFPNLCFVGGILLFLIGIFDGGIKVKSLRLPKIRLAPRILSGVMGVALLTVPTGKFILDTNTLGLYHISELDSKEAILTFSTPAYAQENQEPIRLTLPERHKIVLEGEPFKGNLTFYVSDIHLKKPVKIFLFLTSTEQEEWKDREEFIYNELKERINPKDIILEATVKEGVEISFNFADRKYTLRVNRIIWYLIGKNFIHFEIYAD